MNSRLLIALILILAGTRINAQVRPGNQVVLAEWKPDEIAGNYRIWSISSSNDVLNAVEEDRTAPASKRRITELATGMNYWDGQAWAPSVAEFEITESGFEATRMQHVVSLHGNLNRVGSVSVQTHDGITLHSSPVAIGLYDAVSGQSIIIAAITNSVGVRVAANRIFYENAFAGLNGEGLCADVLYTIERGSFEQDVIIRGRIDPEAYGFPKETTRLQIYTEFYEAPQPQRVRRPIRVENREDVRRKSATPDFVDEVLGFGEFVLATGRAFASEADPTRAAAPVAKEFVTRQGRTFLIESVEYPSIQKEMEALPPCNPRGAVLNKRGAGLRKVEFAAIPAALPRDASAGGSRMEHHERLAKADLAPRAGVVIDYVGFIGGTINDARVFEGDTTYFVSGPVICNGTATIEGGAVFKFKHNTTAPVGFASIKFNNTITCKTTSYRPAIFTAVDDDSVGETMNGVIGTGYQQPVRTDGYANPALWLGNLSSEQLHNLRFTYCQEAVRVEGGSANTLSHAQIVKCIRGIMITTFGCGSGSGGSSPPLTVNNGLLASVTSPVTISRANGQVRFNQCTIQGVSGTTLVTSTTTGASVSFFNCILATISSVSSGSVTMSGDYNGFHNAPQFGLHPFLSSGSPFQIMGAGHYYLANGSNLRDKGSAAVIPGSLLTDMRMRTTDPPANPPASGPSTTFWNPIVLRDAGDPDLGYHYDLLDYLVANYALTGAPLRLVNGVAVAFAGSRGFTFDGGGAFFSEGRADKLNRLVWYPSVQEQPILLINASTHQSALFNIAAPNSVKVIDLRFTDIAMLGCRQAFFDFGKINHTPAVTIRDCQLRGVDFTIWYDLADAPSTLAIAALQNNVLERSTVHLFNGYVGQTVSGFQLPLTVNLYNNLFWKGKLFLAYEDIQATYHPVWNVKDNLFDETLISFTGDGNYLALVQRSNNRFYQTPTSTQLGGTTADNLTALAYTTPAGGLGPWYIGSSTPGLVDQGSRSGGAAGLYHHTLRSNQQREQDTPVDIGFHYVALNGSGFAYDTDSDGLADYDEDKNGNGQADATESSFQQSDTDEDRLPDAFERNSTLTSPLTVDTGNTGFSDAQKDPDNDGLSNYEEFRNNTNPRQADVIPPQISPRGGTFLRPQSVFIECFTEGASIHYTLNGTEPSQLSPSVTSGAAIPEIIDSSTTIKVKAWKTGLTTSKTTTAAYSFSVGSPIFSPPAGIYGSDLMIEMFETTPESIIRVTTDGTEPTTTSPEYTPGSLIPVSASTIFKAKAWHNGQESAVASAMYTIRSAPPNDTFATRRVLTGDGGVTRGTVIGSDINPAERDYMLSTDNSLALHAWNHSVWFEWTPSTTAPVAMDAAGSDFGPTLVAFTGNTMGEYYFDDVLEEHRIAGLEEVARSTSSAMTFNAVAGQSYKIGLFVFIPGNYVLRWKLGPLAAPEFSNPGGTFNKAQTVIVSCSTPGAIIRYTIDGTTPTENSLSLANGSAISITRSLTLKARAWGDDGASVSGTTTATYTINYNATSVTPVVAAPTISPLDVSFASQLSVTLSCSTPGATVRYTLDGSNPTVTSPTIASGGSILLSQSSAVLCRAFKTGMNPSPVVSSRFAKENVDTDFDGIPDTWELLHGSDMFVPDANEISSEPFAHGLTHLQVYSNPSVLIADNYSTGNDGIADWWKAKYGYSLTDQSLPDAIGQNGLSLEDSYEGAFNPRDPNSKPNTLSAPRFSVQWGPQCELFLVLDDIPPTASRLRLFCDGYPAPFYEISEKFTLEFVLPAEVPTILPIPSTRFVNGHFYQMWLQAEDPEGRLSPKVEFLSAGTFWLVFYHQVIPDGGPIREHVKARLRGAGNVSQYHPLGDWSHVWLPEWDWVETLDWTFVLGPPYPPEPTPQDIDIGVFNNLQRFDRDLSLSGLSYSLNQSGQAFLNFAGGQNMFGLNYNSFRFQFLDPNDPQSVIQEVTVFPGQPVPIDSRAYRGSAKVWQTVENASTEPVGYLFKGEDFWTSTDLMGFAGNLPAAIYGNSTPPTANHVQTMDVNQSVRMIGWSQEAVKGANGQAIPNKFFYINQYFDKAFLCPDVQSDVPRTTEDNVGGKKKINLSAAVQAGLLSPYGDFTPTNAGKYILTTLPDQNGKYGECTVYVLPNEIVTRDPDEGIERPADDILYTSAPVPDVTLSLISSTINAQGALQIQVSAHVIDRLSEVADDPSERLQTLRFLLNGEQIDVVNNLPSLSPGSGVLPWQPYRLDVPIERIFTIPNPGPGAFLLRAETSENAVGNVGWDEVGVGVALQEVVFATTQDPLTIALTQAPTSGVADTLKIYFGNRAPLPSDPVCTESTADSLLFSGTLVVSGTPKACEVRIKKPIAINAGVVDVLDGMVTYQVGDGTTRSILTSWKETTVNSLQFLSTHTSSSIVVPAVLHTEELPSSPKGSFEPILVRFSSPRNLVDSEGVQANVNGVRQPIKPFTFSPEKYYLVAQGGDTKPKLLVVNLKNLPPGLAALKPDNLKVTGSGDDLRIQVLHQGREIAGATAALFEDDFGVPPESLTPFAGRVTMPVLLTYFRLLFRETGLELLSYYQLGGNVIELGDIAGDLDIDLWNRLDHNIAIQIEEDLNPIQAASLLWTGLNRVLPWWKVRFLIPDDDFERLDAARMQVGAEATAVGIATAQLYLSGIGVALEPVDWILTLNDLSQGQYAAAVAFLPFVPEGVNFILRRADNTVIGSFTRAIADRVLEGLGKPTRIEKLDNLRVAIDEGVVTREMMEAFIKGGWIPTYSDNWNRKLLIEELGPPPVTLKFPEAHHDLPCKHIDFFLGRGLDINKKEYGRWVEGTRTGSTGRHQNWSRAFNDEWGIWIRANPTATANQILDQMYRMRNSGRYD